MPRGEGIGPYGPGRPADADLAWRFWDSGPVPTRLAEILGRAMASEGPSKEDCIYLLCFPERSIEAGMIRTVADAVSRKRFGNEAMLLGQIGVAMAPCDGGCAFCAFAKPHTTIRESTLSVEETIERAIAFERGGVAGIFIMTMHYFGFEWFLDLVSRVSKALPAETRLLANIGDIDAAQMQALKDAGLTGAYHVCRLREGIDTHMTPRQRIRTIECVRETGLDWYNSCEPIGPEHTPEELAEQIHLGRELGCAQHAAMRRFPVPGSPLFRHGQVSLSRLAQIVAIISLATLESKTVRSIAVHEPNLLGLMSGANALYPEAGEPDPAPEGAPLTGHEATEGFSSALWRRTLEITTADCRKMLLETGFTTLRRGNGTTVPLKL